MLEYLLQSPDQVDALIAAISEAFPPTPLTTELNVLPSMGPATVSQFSLALIGNALTVYCDLAIRDAVNDIVEEILSAPAAAPSPSPSPSPSPNP